jgi:hypothetical protein
MPRPHYHAKFPSPKISYILASQVRRGSSSRTFGCDISLGHTAVNDKVAAVDEAGFIRSQEENSLCLLDGLTEAAGREVNLTPVTLRLVVSEPVLQERGVQRCRAECVEAEALASVNDGELAGHRENGTLGGCVGELRSGGTNKCDHRCSVDDAALGLLVLAERENGVLAAEPHALDVDVLGQVPDLLGCVDGVYDCLVCSFL